MIEFKGVDLTYRNKDIFQKFDLKIERGDKVSILGSSGAGKTTLFNLVLGFEKPQRGGVFFDNVPIDGRSIWDVRRKIAFVDQDVSVGQGRAIDWARSVFSYRANSGKNFSEGKLYDLIEHFEMSPEDLSKEASDLSGGERQRLAISVCILLGRKVFLLDEATSFLHEHLKEKVAEYFIQNKDWTVVVISHDRVWTEDNRIKIFDLEAEEWKQ